MSIQPPKPLLLVSFIFFTAISFAQVNLQNGIIACYAFSGDANDGSGNHHDGNVIGSTLTNDRFGTPKSAYFFDGSDRIVIPAAPIVNHPEITISTWASVSQNPSPNSAQMVFTIGDDDNSNFYGQTLTHHYSGADFTGWGIGGFNQNLVSVAYCTNSLPSEQTWYHLVLTVRPDIVALYINGAKAGEATTGGAPVYYYQRPSSVASIGMRSNGIQGFRGTIDDISIYNRVISAAEIMALYHSGLACAATIPPSPVVEDVTACENDKVTLTASAGTLYRWYDAPDNGNLIFEGNPFTTLELKSTVTFYVANVESAVESVRKPVTITVRPSPVLTCNIPVDGTVAEPIVMTSTTSGTMPFSYAFDFGDETVTTTPASSQVHAYSEGQFLAKITVKDANGCMDECSETIAIAGELFIPNVVTGNGDTLNHMFTVYTVRNSRYNVYKGTNPFAMFIYNRWGEKVFYSENPSEGWSGNSNAPGSYYYHIRLGGNRFKGWLSLLK